MRWNDSSHWGGETRGPLPHERSRCSVYTRWSMGDLRDEEGSIVITGTGTTRQCGTGLLHLDALGRRVHTCAYAMCPCARGLLMTRPVGWHSTCLIAVCSPCRLPPLQRWLCFDIIGNFPLHFSQSVSQSLSLALDHHSSRIYIHQRCSTSSSPPSSPFCSPQSPFYQPSPLRSPSSVPAALQHRATISPHPSPHTSFASASAKQEG